MACSLAAQVTPLSATRSETPRRIEQSERIRPPLRMYETKVPDYMLKREKGKEIGVRTWYFLFEVAGTSGTEAGSRDWQMKLAT
jgi:hypothetical protein